jgi:hypothetical protein
LFALRGAVDSGAFDHQICAIKSEHESKVAKAKGLAQKRPAKVG